MLFDSAENYHIIISLNILLDKFLIDAYIKKMIFGVPVVIRQVWVKVPAGSETLHARVSLRVCL